MDDFRQLPLCFISGIQFGVENEPHPIAEVGVHIGVQWGSNTIKVYQSQKGWVRVIYDEDQTPSNTVKVGRIAYKAVALPLSYPGKGNV